MASPDTTRDRLLEAAGEVFAARGFENATVREICRAAGTNVAAINYHFGDKEQLYTQAVLEAHRYCIRQSPEPEPELDESEPAELLRAQIRHFLGSVLAIQRIDDWHHSLLLREIFRPTGASGQLVREVIRPRFERLGAIIRRLRPDLEGLPLRAAVFSVVGQCIFYKLARPIAERLIGPDDFREMSLEFLTDHITDFTLGALRADDPEAVLAEGRGDAP